jgi:tetratricopeptide (TPR) repeat protein
MKRQFIGCVLAAVVAVLCAPVAWAQTAVVKGYVHDVEGKPMAGVTVQLMNKDNGRKYDLKTDKKGDYYSLGIQSGRYDLVVLQDGKTVWRLTNIPIQLSEEANIFNIDLQKEQKAQQAQISPEQKKQMEAQEKEVAKLKSLNDLVAQAKAAEDQGNLQQAASVLTQATQLDPTKNVLWARLAEVELAQGKKTTDPAEKKAIFAKSAEDYKKAIAIKPNGGYYNNLAEAMARTGDTQAAMQAYEEAVKVDPQGAGLYYFNEGATLTNMGKVDEALQAFDKAIQADPARAEAYYWKGVNLMGKATLKGNKMEAPPGTSEAFNKYLELQPTGQFADPAKQMLTSIGATVETSFGKGKTAPKTKK